MHKIFYIFICIVTLNSVSNSFTINISSSDEDSTDDPTSNEIVTEQDTLPFTIGFTYLYGYALPHAKEVVNIRGTHPIGYEVNFNWLLYTDEVWDDCHCYPRLGFLVAFYDYDINEIFGYGLNASGQFTYFFGLPSTFNFLLMGKAGISYLTKPFDRNTHPENMSYSTHINYLLSIGAGTRLAFNKNLETQFIVSMNHNSNAAFLEPNGGINYPALSLNMSYTFNPVDIKPRYHKDTYLNRDKKKRWDFSAFWGISGMPYPDEAQVPMFGINILRSWQVTRIGAINAGVEVEMNGRARLRVQRGTIDDISPWRASVQTGWEFLMGRTIFSIQLGFYLYRPYQYKDDVYQRFTLVHRILNHLYAGISFKSYRHYADHLDLRLTYSF